MKQKSIAKFRLQLVREECAPLYGAPKMTSSKSVFDLLTPHFLDCPNEEFVCVFIDAKHAPSGWLVVSVGSLTMSVVHPREAFKAAIACNAANVIFSHNHPSGDPTPSPEDRALTKRLVECGELLGVRVLDHVVIGEGRYVSFADQGWL